MSAHEATRAAGSPLAVILECLHAEFVANSDGAVATYIPELGRADPSRFGISIATVDGDVFDIGDADAPFTIQSISKPFVFGLALQERGIDTVLERVGVEPSGDPFNAITVDSESSRPFNPMVNAGAIVTTGLLDGTRAEGRLSRIRTALSRYAGRALDLDEGVLASEHESGDRNRALAWLMRSFDMLGDDVYDTLDAYFGQCSMLVTSRDFFALMAATLANGGRQPRTGERALESTHVTNVLSVMTTCGMYDYAGEWVYDVGLPAKSGVSGGVIAVLPGHFGIGVYSPPLDARGNSVRGIEVCRRLSRDLQLHLLRTPSAARSVVRNTVAGTDIRSNRLRTSADEEAISERRRSIVVHDVQGDLYFATTEKVHRTVMEHLDDVRFVVVDFSRVTDVDEPALGVVEGLARAIQQSGRVFVTVTPHEDSPIAHVSASIARFADADTALEWCEEQLLLDAPRVGDDGVRAAIEHLEFLEGLSPDALADVAAAVETRAAETGEVVFREGDLADAMYFLLEGRISVRLPLTGDRLGRTRRLATFGPGVAFGELALLDEGKRSADVVCDEHSTIGALPLEAFRRLEAEHPRFGRVVYGNLARLLAERLRAANRQIRALER